LLAHFLLRFTDTLRGACRGSKEQLNQLISLVAETVLMKIEFHDNEPVSYSVRGMYTLTKRLPQIGKGAHQLNETPNFS